MVQITRAMPIINVSMKRPDYFIAFEENSSTTLSEFKAILESLPKKRVGSLTVEELCSVSEYPNGIYLLYDEVNILWYVGKSTSRSFIERIPAHFDQREEAWFNSIPKNIMKKKGVSYSEALQKGLNLGIALVGVKSKSVATKLETTLRASFQPYLNTCKGNFSGDDKISLITDFQI